MDRLAKGLMQDLEKAGQRAPDLLTRRGGTSATEVAPYMDPAKTERDEPAFEEL